MENKLENEFYNIEQENAVSELQHYPAEGWNESVWPDNIVDGSLSLNQNQEIDNQDSIYESSYAESDYLTNEACLCASSWYESGVDNEWIDPDDGMDANSRPCDDEWYANTHEEESMDSLIEEEEFSIQKENVALSWYESGVDNEWIDPDDGMDANSRPCDDGWYANTHEEESMDSLIEEEEFSIQKENVALSWYESGVDNEWIDPDDGMDANSRPCDDGWYANTHEEESMDSLIMESMYENQKSDVIGLTVDNSEEYISYQQNNNYYSNY